MPVSATAARRALALAHAGGLLETLEPLLQLSAATAVGQRRVGLPPVDPHLPRLVDGRDEQAQLDVQQLDVEQVDRDVACDDDALVEHALEDVGQALAAAVLGGQSAAVSVRRAHPSPSPST